MSDSSRESVDNALYVFNRCYYDQFRLVCTLDDIVIRLMLVVGLLFYQSSIVEYIPV